MRAAHLSCLSMLILLAGTASAAPARGEPIPVRFGPASGVKDAAELEKELAAPLDMRVHVRVKGQRDPRRVRTCAELAGGLPGSPEPDDVVDFRPMVSRRVHCRALLWLREARPARASFLGPLPLTVPGVGALPAALRFWILPPGEKPPAGLVTWKDADPSLRAHPRASRPPELMVLSDHYEAIVSVYARGDFDGDGLEDTLIARDAFPIGGSYQDTSIFLITRRAPKAPLTVIRTFSDGY